MGRRAATVATPAAPVSADATAQALPTLQALLCVTQMPQSGWGWRDPAEDGVWVPEQARAARRVLIRELRFFGPKSASDYLLGLGVAECLLAFDVRILNLLVDCLGWNPRIRRQVATLRGYELVEQRV